MSHKTFSREMQEIRDEVLLLSSMVEQAVMSSVEALKDNDLEYARQILSRDIVINKKTF
jgi:phosphate transport system protein